MPSEAHYQGLNGMAYALEKDAARKRRSRWIVVGSLVALCGLIAIGVGVGVSVSNNNKNNSSSSSSSSSSGSSGDPSSFALDSSLHKSLYGIAYTPEGSLLPDCGNSLEDVIKDVQLMSQLTTRVRLYGADCNQSALVLEAIQQTKTDIEVYLGIYPVPDDTAVFDRQLALVKDALETYGADHVAGITVGNEFILNYLNSNAATDPNGVVGNAGGQILIDDVAATRKMVEGLNLGKTIPIGNSDAGSYFNTKVLEAVDYGLSNVHAWFANTTVQDAAEWTTTFFNEQNVQPAALLSNKPEMYIAETGWPSKSSDAGNANNGASDASEANLQIFLDTFVCQANTAGTKYFYFEFFDEQWKDDQFGGVEGWWGLFNKDRTLKGITIPDCISP